MKTTDDGSTDDRRIGNRPGASYRELITGQECALAGVAFLGRDAQSDETEASDDLTVDGPRFPP